jgi:hypothetical protein
MSGGFLLTPKEMREAYDVSAQTLAARAGVDTAGLLADDVRTEAERARAVGIQVPTAPCPRGHELMRARRSSVCYNASRA